MRTKKVYIPELGEYDVHIDNLKDDSKILVYLEESDEKFKLVGIISKYHDNAGGFDYKIAEFDMTNKSDLSSFDDDYTLRGLMKELHDQLGCTFEILED